MNKSRILRTAFPPLFTAIPVGIGCLALLQAAFFYLDDANGYTGIVGLIFSVLVLCTALFFRFTRISSLFPLLLYCYWAQLALFSLRMVNGEPSSAPRLLQTSLVLIHCEIVAIVLALGFQFRNIRKFFLLSLVFFLFFFLAESVLPRANPVRAEGVAELNDPHIRNKIPGSLQSKQLDSNTSNLMKDSESLEGRVWLRTAGDNSAELNFRNEYPASVRIVIQKAGSKNAFDIQLNMSQIRVKSNAQYVISFRARSDQNRSMYVGFARSHDSWEGLGLYKMIALAPEWRHFKESFTTRDADENGRIHFDLGEESSPVEISSIQIVPSAGNKELSTEVSTNAFVEYRVNSMGCRGPDYRIPKDPGVKRILVLGDDYTLGTGIPESDTFVSRLDVLLNKTQNAKQSNEVINCGVSGFRIRQIRKFFETNGVRYEPDFVLLIISLPLSLEQIEKQFDTSSPFLILDWFRTSTQPRLKPDFTQLKHEIGLLHRAAQQQKGMFAVVLFRDNVDYSGETVQGKVWNQLTEAVALSLKKWNVPVFDIASNLYAKYSKDDLTQTAQALPNPFAHQLAANEIFRLLQEPGILKQTEATRVKQEEAVLDNRK